MATPQQVIAEVRAKLGTSFPTWTELESQYRTDIDNVSVDTTGFQLRWQMERQENQSDVTRNVMAFDVVVYHHLALWNDPKAYTEAVMPTEQVTLLDPNWWRDMSTVQDVLNEGGTFRVELDQDVAREGDMISWSVAALVVVVA